MTLELVKALLVLARACMAQVSCDNCPLKEFCGKLPSEWYSTPAAMRLNFRKVSVLALFVLICRKKLLEKIFPKPIDK